MNAPNRPFSIPPLLSPALALAVGVLLSEFGAYAISNAALIGLIFFCALLLFVLHFWRNRLKKTITYGLVALAFASVGFSSHQFQNQPPKTDLSLLVDKRLKYEAVALSPVERTAFDAHIDAELRYVFSQTSFSPIRGIIRLNLGKNAPDSLKAGDKIRFSGKLKPIGKAGKTKPFQKYLHRKGIFYRIKTQNIEKKGEESGIAFALQNYRVRLVNILNRRFDNKQTQAVAAAILLGQRAEIDKDLNDAYVRAGVAHILALSGSHIVTVAAMLALLFYPTVYFDPSRRLQNVLVCFSLIAFAILTGLSASVVRAVVLAVVYLLGVTLYRKPQLANILSATFLIQLIINPNELFDVGFQLSYAAVLGIALFTPLLSDWRLIKKHWALNGLWQVVAVTLSAQLFVTPLLLYHFGALPVYFIAANLLAHGLATAILVLGYGLLAFDSVPLVSDWLANGTALCIDAMNYSTKVVGFAPGSSVEDIYCAGWQAVLMYLILFAGTALAYQIKAVLAQKAEANRKLWV